MCPCQRFAPSLRLATHDSGTGWLATPFLYGSFIHNSKPVYPGALNKLLIGTWTFFATFAGFVGKTDRGHYLLQYWLRNPKTSSAQTLDPK
jgi:hypothetical protein